LTAGPDISLRDAPLVHRAGPYRLRPLLALLALLLALTAGLFGIAASSQNAPSDALMLFSCGPCHD
jgi:hypothetical protein